MITQYIILFFQCFYYFFPQDLTELFMQAGGQKKLKKLFLSLIGFEKLLDLLGEKYLYLLIIHVNL